MVFGNKGGKREEARLGHNQVEMEEPETLYLYGQ